MRIYNKWYEELWFWIQENEEELILIITGLGLLAVCIWSYIRFLRW